MHNAGLELHIWTVDNLTRMQQLIDLGVDGITTNAPQTLRSIVPLPGDYNYDSVVDSADYVVWRKTVGDSETYNAWRQISAARLVWSGAKWARKWRGGGSRAEHANVFDAAWQRWISCIGRLRIEIAQEAR